MREIVEHVAQIAAMGGGVSRSYVSHGLFAIVHGRYVIYFRQTKDAIQILRILNGARDVSGLQFDG